MRRGVRIFAVPVPPMLKLVAGCCDVVFWMNPLGDIPPSCPALVAVSAEPAVALRTAYGEELIGWRGDRIVRGLGLPATRMPISRNRAEPSNIPVPKSS